MEILEYNPIYSLVWLFVQRSRAAKHSDSRDGAFEMQLANLTEPERQMVQAVDRTTKQLDPFNSNKGESQ